MRTAVIVFLILALLFSILGFLPLLGWLNWLALPLHGILFILSIIGLASAKGESKGIYVAGLIISIIFSGVSLVRLVIGGGVV